MSERGRGTSPGKRKQEREKKKQEHVTSIQVQT